MACGKLLLVYQPKVFASFILILAFSLALARAQADGYWSNNTGGSWANGNNWLDGTIANGTDSSAYFGFSGYPINANAVFTLDGAQTVGFLYFFSNNNWTFNAGSGGSLTLSIDLNEDPQINISSAQQRITFNAVLAGNNGMELLGAGTLALNAANTYTGGTIISSGILLVNGSLADTNTLAVNGGILGGAGVISGPVVVASSAMLSPGGSPGTLTISNSLTLQTGSKTWIDINASTLAHDSVNGLSVANYGGSLIVSNLAGTPSLGQSFPIFSAAGSSGGFTSISPQLTGALRWKFNTANGMLSVISTNSQPRFARVSLVAGPGLLLSVTNGVPGSTNYLLATTNLALPRTNWTRVATNLFDVGGNLALTNAIPPAPPLRFFQLMTP
jgi:autotransporter-associated beta strand protein